jgi:hypothetical protein
LPAQTIRDDSPTARAARALAGSGNLNTLKDIDLWLWSIQQAAAKGTMAPELTAAYETLLRERRRALEKAIRARRAEEAGKEPPNKRRRSTGRPSARRTRLLRENIRRLGRQRCRQAQRARVGTRGAPCWVSYADRKAIMARAHVLKRPKGARMHYGDIAGKDPDILWVLLTINRTHKTGLCFPSYTTIAERAGCHPSTVGRGIQRLKAAGLLDWANCTRIGVVEGRRRFLRSSNAYTFVVPVEKSSRMPRPSLQMPRESKASSSSSSMYLRIGFFI